MLKQHKLISIANYFTASLHFFYSNDMFIMDSITPNIM